MRPSHDLFFLKPEKVCFAFFLFCLYGFGCTAPLNWIMIYKSYKIYKSYNLRHGARIGFVSNSWFSLSLAAPSLLLHA